MLKLCIFDMDGTLVDTLKSIRYFANKALNKYSLDSVDEDKYKIFVGNGAKNLIKRLVNYTGGTEEQFEKVLKEYNTTYDNDFLYLAEPYEDIIKMLEILKAQNIKIAILSNKPHSTAKKISDALFSEKFVDICYGSRENVKLKPDPEGVFELLSYFNVTADECLYIGDTATDIETAKNAGVKSIGVLWGFRDFEELSGAGANYIVKNPLEICKIANTF